MFRRLFIVSLTLTILIGLSKGFNHPLKLVAQINPTTEQTTTAPLFNNLGNYHHSISTQSSQAQRYFDQGLTLAYGFNHAEAARSFKEAARLDPNCAMCYWGLAYVLGPNINAPMEADTVPPAWEAVQKAIKLSKNASEREKDYIKALGKRYSADPKADRKPLDLAFAAAMEEVSLRYPKDWDAATIYAEALMNTMPWDYWQEDGQPKPESIPMIKTLEDVLKHDPDHPGANHYYIHAVEKERPELGIAAADRLQTLVPGAGHLVHMSSHIYIRVGRYHDAVVANQRGIEADRDYITQCHAQGLYPLAYMPHNHHFLWFAAMMDGQSEVALEAAHHTGMVDEKLMRQPGLDGALQHFFTIPFYTQIRFEKWDKILATPAPAKDLRYPLGVWHYARGMAFVNQNQPDRAKKELEQVQAIAAEPAMKELMIWGFNSTASVLDIAQEVLSAQIAAKEQDYDSAIAHLQKAVTLEDAMTYTEPADWYQPTRQALGEMLLKADRPSEAEKIFREDLDIYPENGWSLYGLAQSLQAQNKTAEAQKVQKRFKRAWKYADISLNSD